MRANFFKVYLTNPSIRSALFSPLEENGEFTTYLAETGIFSQWFHSQQMDRLYYARWERGEVDIVHLNPNQKPDWVVEVKWSDRYVDNRSELRSLLAFCREHSLTQVLVTTKNAYELRYQDDLPIQFVPTSLYCLSVGANLLGIRKDIASH
jgi:uncharacterized protein